MKVTILDAGTASTSKLICTVVYNVAATTRHVFSIYLSKYGLVEVVYSGNVVPSGRDMPDGSGYMNYLFAEERNQDPRSDYDISYLFACGFYRSVTLNHILRFITSCSMQDCEWVVYSGSRDEDVRCLYYALDRTGSVTDFHQVS